MEILKFINSSELSNWSVQFLLQSEIDYSNSFPLIPLAQILKRNKTSVDIESNKKYKRVTIKINNGGVFLRDIELGNNIGTKKQFQITENQFILSKIDARNGAFGIANSEVNGAIITGNFWAYDVDYSQVNPVYLSLITTTNQFINFCQKSSVGTTNRNYLQEDLFLAEKIPLPDIDTQKSLVSAYKEKIKQAEILESQAKKIDIEIEQYLFESLGIQIEQSISQQNQGILQFVDFKNLDKWVFNDIELDFFNKLNKSFYPLQPLGKAVQFITRSWKKQEKEKQYIEIGSIDSDFGIIETKTIFSKRSPSRATQIVKLGDLIIGTTRPYLKKFVIIKEEFDNFVASSGFSVIQECKDEYNLEYVNQVLRSKIGIGQFEIKMTGSLYPAITQSELEEIKIPFPPIETQNQIANHIDALKQTQKQAKTQAKTLREQVIVEFERAIFE